jgi:hypothetical protein
VALLSKGSVFFVAVLGAFVPAFSQAETPDFRTVVESRLKGTVPKGGLAARCPIDEDWVAARVFVEYGAIYVAKKPAVVPSKCIVESEAELAAMHALMNARTAKVGGFNVTLQEPALKALLKAQADAASAGLAFTLRDAPVASVRSYDETLRLWTTRFEPALQHWVRRGRITRADADAARNAPIREQIEAVLAWEDERIWFSTALTTSILYSVAIPGASQHNFMLAIDIEQFGNPRVRQILANHGWFQTVKSDLPHFTYLGLKEADLPKNGLRPVMIAGQKFWIPNVIDEAK